jgi:hypothetical protein
VSYDDNGIPWKMTSKDKIQGLTLELNLREKKAVLTEDYPAEVFEVRHGIPTSLFMLEEWLNGGKVTSELGTREIQGRSVIGLRVTYGERQADFWVDCESRRIVRFLEPTAAKYDPEKDPVARNPTRPESEIWGQEIKGWIWTDIVYDPPLDHVQFVLVPPSGYEVKTISNRKNHRVPTEKDLTDWLEVFAHVRGGTFTDNENSPGAIGDLTERIEKKPAEQRTVWEQKFIRGAIEKDELPLKGGSTSVLVTFYMTYHDTWHYQGKGVKLGDANTPICWYRPKGAMNYRVVYGDLRVKDVAPNELPKKR